MAAIETARLRLRQWRDEDLEPFARMNADPAVMEHFVAPLAREASDAMAQRMRARIDERGWGQWAVEVRASGAFAGFVGLAPAPATLPCAPAMEVGWRLAREHWGKGYASEAARRSLRYGFEELDLDEIVSFTTLANARSRAVMKRIGLREDGARAFQHPNVPEGHPVRPHCLYRITREEWERITVAGNSPFGEAP